jgi:carbonic anhydrase
VQSAASPDTAPVSFTYRPTAGELVDNGHTLQMNLQPGSTAVVDGHAYDLVQFHIHTPSEHTVGGEALPMEVHLVHKDKAGKLAVVGVRFAAGTASAAMTPVWAAAPAKGGKAKVARFDPATLLPRDRSAYRYDGSLTTPPCSEGVEWIVMRRTATDSAAHIEAFEKRFGANARPVQPLFDRAIE